jgi:hypothetical protein
VTVACYSREALERQIAERQAATELEQKRDAAFADRMLVTEQRVQLMERDVQRVSLRRECEEGMKPLR